MGQVFDRTGQFLGDMMAETKRDVFDGLMKQFPDAAKIVIQEVGAEMPRYQSHKKVWALKIAGIVLDSAAANLENRETDGSAAIVPAESGYAPFKVDHAYMRKHDPQVGGYYVVYADGYKSYSPAEAFESGYTRL